MKSLKPFYLALDVSDPVAAKKWCGFAQKNELGVKIGLQAFLEMGTRVIEMASDHKLSILFDVKLFDIPTTVLKAIDGLVKYNVDAFTIHCQCGEEVFAELRQHMRSPDFPVPFCVTALTSIAEEDLPGLGVVGLAMDDYVLRLARRAVNQGVSSFVCAVSERERLRSLCSEMGARPRFLCPGIRLPDGDLHDQKRILGTESFHLTADSHFVLGRAITEARDSDEALRAIRTLVRGPGETP